jgi:predicted RNase H-like HicB family nuclease
MNKKVKKVQVLKYTAMFTPEEEGGYSVYVPALPGCFSQGETFEKATANTKEAIELYLEDIAPLDLDLLFTEVESFVAPVEVVLV